MHILLIEPDAILASAYGQGLEHYGHTVELSAAAQDAVHLADDRAPDLVVLELNLPGHSGAEFLYEFRSYDDWQTIPIIVLSGLPEAELAITTTTWRQLGVIGYCYKPQTTIRQLLSLVNQTKSITA